MGNNNTTNYKLNFEVTGQNSLASAIRSIGSALSSINIDGLTDIIGAAGILSGMSGNTIRFDVESGDGIQKSIHDIRALLAEMSKIDTLRKEMEKADSQINRFNTVAQTAIVIPEQLAPKNLKIESNRVLQMVNSGQYSNDISSKLHDISIDLLDASRTIKDADIGKMTLDPQAREWVEKFTDVNSLIRHTITGATEDYAGMSGRVRDTIGTVFKEMSRKERDKIIFAFKDDIKVINDEIAKTRSILADKNSLTEDNKRALNMQLAQLLEEKRMLQLKKTGFEEARDLLNKESKFMSASDTKTTMAVASQAEVKKHENDLQKLFKEITFINNKTSAGQILEVIKKREKDLIDFIMKSDIYGMTEPQLAQYSETSMNKKQEILKYRYLMQMKGNVLPDNLYQGLAEGKTLYDIPKTFNKQRIEELQKQIQGITPELRTEKVKQIYAVLENFKKLTDRFGAGTTVILTDKEIIELGDFVGQYKEISKNISKQKTAGRSSAIDDAKGYKYDEGQLRKIYNDTKDKLQNASLLERERFLDKINTKIKQQNDEIAKQKKLVTGVDKEQDRASLLSIKRAALEISKLNSMKDAYKDFKVEQKELDKQKTKSHTDIDKSLKQQKQSVKEIITEEEKSIQISEKIAADEMRKKIDLGERVVLSKVLAERIETLKNIEQTRVKLQDISVALSARDLAIAELKKKGASYFNQEKIKELEIEKENLNIQRLQLLEEQKSNRVTLAKQNVLVNSTKAHKQNISALLGEYLSLDKIVARMSFVWTAMFSYGTANAIRSMVSEIYQSALKLDESMQKIKSIMGEFESRFIPQLEKAIVGMSAAYGKSIEDVGKAMYETMSSNFNPEFAKELVDTASKMAVANISTVEDATSLMISAVNSYGFSMNELSRISDVFFQLIKYGRTNVSDLTKNFSSLSSTAALIGMDFRDMTTALAVMTNQGIETDQAITALNRLLTNFARGGTKEAIEIAHRLGFEMNTSAITADGMIGLIKKLEGATEQEVVALSGNVRAFKALATAINDTATYQEFYNKMVNSAGSTQDAFNDISKSATFRLAKMKQEIIGSSMSIANDFIPTMITAKSVLSSVSQLFGMLPSKFVATTAQAGILYLVITRLVNAFKDFKLVLTKTLPGLAILAVSLVTAKLAEMEEKSRNAKARIEDLNAQIDADITERSAAYTKSERERAILIKTQIKSVEELSNKIKSSSSSDNTKTAALSRLKLELKEIQKEYPHFFENLDTEKLTLDNNLTYWDNYKSAIENTTKSLDRYIESLLVQAKVTASVNLVEENQTGLLKEQSIKRDARVKFYNEMIKTMHGKGTADMFLPMFDESIKKIASEYKIGNTLQNSTLVDMVISDVTKSLEGNKPLQQKFYANYASGDFGKSKTIRGQIEDLLVYQKRINQYEKNITDATKYVEQYVEELSKMGGVPDMTPDKPPLEKGERKFSETVKKTYTDRINALKKEFMKAVIDTDTDAFTEDDKAKLREREKTLFDNIKSQIELAETPEERESLYEDFAKWFYETKKERYDKVLTVLRNRLEREQTVEGQEKIRERISEVLPEMLLNASQYMSFSAEDKNYIDKSTITIQDGLLKLVETGKNLEDISSGKYASELQNIVEATVNLMTDIEKMRKEYNDGSKKIKPEIVKEMIKEIANDLNITANGVVKGFEDLNAEDVEKLLSVPYLPADVKTMLEMLKAKFDMAITESEKETNRRLDVIKNKRSETQRRLDDILSGKNLNPLSMISTMFDLFNEKEFGSQEEEDIKYNEAKRNRNRNALSKTGAYKAGDKNFLSMTEEQERENQSVIDEYEKNRNARRVEILRGMLTSMKDLWNEYYNWQKERINDWYEKQSEIIQNKAKYEYRSQLWLEKEQEKLDKERAKKEKKYARQKQAVSISEALINGAVAILRIFKDFTFPVAVILSALMSGITAANVKVISSQKFGKGGKVYGTSHSYGGVPIEVEGDEFIMSKKAAKGNEAILYAVQNMLENKRAIQTNSVSDSKIDRLISAVEKLDIRVEMNAEVLSEVKLWKRTVKGQRLAKVM